MDGVSGLGSQENYIFQYCLDHFGVDAQILSLDDDFRGIAKGVGLREYKWGTAVKSSRVLTSSQTKNFLLKAFRVTHSKGAFLWGLNTSCSLLSLDLPGAAPKQSLGLVNGACYGYIVTDDPDLYLRETGPRGALEDFERCQNNKNHKSG